MEEELYCSFCSKKFKSKSSLNFHIKTAKKCLKNRENKESVLKFKCEYCLKNFSSKQNLKNHQKICFTLIITQKNMEIKELRDKLEIYKSNVTVDFQTLNLDLEDFEYFCIISFINNIDLFTEKKIYKTIISILHRFLVDPINKIPLVICSDKSRCIFKYKDNNIITDNRAYLLMSKLENSFINISNRMKSWFYDIVYNNNNTLPNKYYSYSYNLLDCKDIENSRKYRRELFLSENRHIYEEPKKIETYIKWDKGIKDFYKGRFDDTCKLLTEINDKFIYRPLSIILPSKFSK